MAQAVFKTAWQLPECQCPSFAPHPTASVAAASLSLAVALLSLTLAVLLYHGARFSFEIYECLCCVRPVRASSSKASDTENDVAVESEEEQKKLAHAVNRAMEAKRLERVRTAARVVANVLPGFLFLQIALHSGYLWEDMNLVEDRDLWRQVSPPMLYGALVSTLWQAAPWLVTPSMVDIAHVFMYLIFFVCGTMYKNNEIEFLHSAMWIICVRIGIVVAAGNFILASVLDGMLCFARIIFLYASMDIDDFPSYAFGELWVFAAVVVVCKLVESSLLAEVRSTVEARNSSQAESTVHSLLSAMCDAVVQVGHDFQIQRPAPRLALLLLMNNTVKHLKGTKFTDLMAEPDEERFRAVAEDRKTTTASLNVHLRGEFGARVGVRLFLARCPANEDEEISQLVGVSVDEEPGMSHVPQSIDTSWASPMVQRVLADSARNVANGRSYQSSRSNASAESLPLHHAENDEVAVWLDPSDRKLTVVSCTVGFTLICGPASAGRFSLLKAIANADSFLPWFQHCYTARLYQDMDGDDVDAGQELLDPLEVTLLPQGSCSKRIVFAATCAISDVSEVQGKELVKLTFHDLSEVDVPPKAQHAPHRGRVRDALPSELPGYGRASTSGPVEEILM